MTSFLETLADIERRYDDLEHLLADPAVTSDHLRLQEIGRERSDLEPVVTVFRELRDTESAISDTTDLSDDPEMAELVEEELRELRSVATSSWPGGPSDSARSERRERCHRRDTRRDRRRRSGPLRGGSFRMYTRYAERNRWKAEVLSATETDGGGFREIIFEVRGKSVQSSPLRAACTACSVSP